MSWLLSPCRPFVVWYKVHRLSHHLNNKRYFPHTPPIPQPGHPDSGDKRDASATALSTRPPNSAVCPTTAIRAASNAARASPSVAYAV